MTRKQYTTVALIALLSLTNGLCIAQSTTSHISIEPEVQQTQARSLLNNLQEIILRLDLAKGLPVQSAGLEGEVLRAARQSAQQSLLINLEGTASGYAIPTDQGDTLVVRWKGTADSQRPEIAVWLWDTPFYTTFLMELDPAVLQASQFPAYCEGLFIWERFIELKSLKLSYLDSRRGHEQIIGRGKYLQTEQGDYRLWFAAMSSNDKAYVAVGMSKPIFSDKYPREAYQIPERFPPLRERLKGTARRSLFDEIGKGYIGGRLVTYPTNRDEIVIGELLSRGPLTDAEVQQIVIGDFDKGDYQSALLIICRLSAFLQSVEARGELTRYSRSLEALLLAGPIHIGADEAVAGHVFGAMEQNHVDFSGAALAFLQRGRYANQSLRFLNQNARDYETLQKLSEIVVKPELEGEKRAILENIKKRLKTELKTQ